MFIPTRGKRTAIGLIVFSLLLLARPATALDSTLVRLKLTLNPKPAQAGATQSYTLKSTTKNTPGADIRVGAKISYAFPPGTVVSGATGTFKTTGAPVGVTLTFGTDGQGRPTIEFLAPSAVGTNRAFTTAFVGIVNPPNAGSKSILVAAENSTFNGTTGYDRGTFAYTVAPGPASKLGFVQQPTSPSYQNRTIIPPVTVAVQDEFGNTITSSTASVSMAITSGTGAPGAVLSGTLTRSAVSGIASFSDLSIDLKNAAGSPYKLRATSSPLALADSSAFDVTDPPPNYLEFSVQPPVNTVAGANMMVEVTVKDALTNQPVTSPSMTISLFSSPIVPIYPGGAQVVTADTTNGAASFNVNLHQVGSYNFVATASNTSGASSSSFIVNPGPASTLAFIAQPSDTAAGKDDGTPTSPISPILAINGDPVEVAVQDGFGNIVPGRTDTITISINTGTAGAMLTGNLSAIAGSAGSQGAPPDPIDSIAIFDNLNIDLAGLYTLRAQAPGLSDGISAEFTITPDTAALLVVSGINDPSVLGAPSNVTVSTRDQFGNVDSNYTGTVTFSSSDSEAFLPSDYTFSGTDGGSHVFVSGVTFRQVGLAQSVTATDTVNSAITGSQSVLVTQGNSSTTVLGAFPNPSGVGENVSFTARVSGAGVTPTGSVTFKDGGAPLATVPLDASGEATFSTNTLTQGTHSISADYSGDTNYINSSSGSYTQSVVANSSTTTLANSPATTVFGEAVSFTATITSSPAGTPTGSVTFTEGATVLGSAAVGGGQATLTTTALSVGTHTVQATYNGDINVGASVSNTVTQTVNPAATTTNVASSASPAVFGESVTFTATVNVTAPGAGTPSGNVIFTLNGQAQGPVTLSGNMAQFTTLSLSVGVHTISADYSGDGSFVGSAGTLAGGQTVNKAATTAGVTSSVNPSVFGQAVILTATVAVTAPGAGTPSGSVVFTIGGVAQQAVALSGNSAALSVSTLSVGNHTVSAAYSGDGNFANSGGILANGQTVNQAGTSTALASSANPSVAGQAVTFTATVSVSAPGAGAPSGSVTFSVDGLQQAPIALSNGAAAFSLATLSIGSHAVSAGYSGDGSFAASAADLGGGQSVIPGPAASLDISGLPASTTAGSSMDATIIARDANGNVATGYRGTIQFASTDPNATLPPSYTFTADDNGSHVFVAGVTLRSAGDQSVTAADAVDATVSGTRAVAVSHGPAARMAFSVQPGNSEAGGVLRPAVEVKIQDGFGNAVPEAGGNVSISLGNNPGNGKLSGTLSVSVSSGVAKFSDLSINKTGSGYTLTVTSFGLSSATSAPFNVVDTLPPLALSPLTSSVSNAVVGMEITFSWEVSDASPVTYTWNWGDGTSVVSEKNSLSHVFNSAGDYTVTVTATDSGGLSTSASLTLHVAATAAPASFADVCKSGIELAAQQVSARLRFPASTKDSIGLKAILTLKAGFTPTGQVVEFDIGGIHGQATLSAKGMSAPSRNLKVMLKVKKPSRKNPSAAPTGNLSIALKNQNLSALKLGGIAALNATTGNKGNPATVDVCVVLAGQAYHKEGVAGAYKAKVDKAGAFSAKKPR